MLSLKIIYDSCQGIYIFPTSNLFLAERASNLLPKAKVQILFFFSLLQWHFFANYFIILRIALSCSFLKSRFQYLLRKKRIMFNIYFAAQVSLAQIQDSACILSFSRICFGVRHSQQHSVSTRRHSLSRAYPLQWAVPVAYDRWQKPTDSMASSLHSDTSGAPDSLSHSWEPFCYATAIIHLLWSIWNESTR